MTRRITLDLNEATAAWIEESSRQEGRTVSDWVAKRLEALRGATKRPKDWTWDDISPAVRALHGTLAVPGEPPLTDEEVDRMRWEALQEKYGSLKD